MGKMLLFRLDRAITCVNADDPDKTFNEKLSGIRVLAQFLNKEIDAMEEIIDIIDDCLSRAKHSQKERERVVKQLHSFQENMMKQAL